MQRVLISYNKTKLLQFKKKLTKDALHYKKLQAISNEYCVPLNGSKKSIIKGFENFFLEGLDFEERNRTRTLIKMGGEDLLARVEQLLEDISFSLDIHQNIKAKQKYISSEIYSYTSEPKEIKLFRTIQKVSKTLQALDFIDSKIEALLKNYQWEIDSQTIDCKKFESNFKLIEELDA